MTPNENDDDGSQDDNDDGNGNDGNVQEVSRLKQEAQYFRLGGLLAQLTETGPRLGVDGELIFLGSFFGTIF